MTEHLPDSHTTEWLVLIFATQVARMVTAFLRNRRDDKGRKAARATLDAALAEMRLDIRKAEAQAREAAEHAASLNRKKWREQNPGKVTPDPNVEPRTFTGPNPLKKK